MRAIGPTVPAFDWSTQKCNDNDIPDQPSRAYRNAAGKVVLINSHFTVRRKVGDTLTTVANVCSPIAMTSGVDADPSKYDDREWLASPYTTDGGTTVYGLIHAEYQGYNHSPGYCIRSGESFADKQKCWYNAITLAKSTNGGETFSHAAPPFHYIAGPPYKYVAGTGPIGFFQPSNIVRGKDGFYYVLVHVEDYGAQPYGSCLWRAADLENPQSWRGWDGTDFTLQFRDPYRYSYPPEEGVCAPVSRDRIGTLSESLTWSTFLKKWVLVGSADNADGVSGSGFYYYTSDDLINWSNAKLLMKAELPWTYNCQDGPEQLRDPSLLDEDTTSQNFETIGQRPYLFFTRFNVQFNSNGTCFTSLDRDLIRIPIEFSAPQPDPQPDPPPDPPPGGGGGGGGSGGGGGTPAGGGSTGGGGGTGAGSTGTPAQTPAAAPVTTATPPIGLFRLVGKPRWRPDGSVLLRVRAPAAGRLTVRGVGARPVIRPAAKQASAAGTITVTLRLSKTGRTLLRGKRRATVRTALRFTPVGGAPQKSQRALVLQRTR